EGNYRTGKAGGEDHLVPGPKWIASRLSQGGVTGRAPAMEHPWLFRPSQGEIGGGAEEKGRASGLSEMTEGLIEQREQIRKEMDLGVEKKRHVAGRSSRFCRKG